MALQTEDAGDWKPAAAFVARDAAGRPYLAARRCRACGIAGFVETLACPACCARDGFDRVCASDRGVLHSWSIVHRSYPGVAVPFVSAVVDLDDGLTLKGNLRGVAADPAALAAGTCVRVVFDEALGRTDKDGSRYLSYFFEPAGDA